MGKLYGHSMRFMMIFYMPEDSWIDKETVRRVVSWKKKWRDAGVWEQGSPLKPAGMSHTLTRSANGKVDVKDCSHDVERQVFFAFEILNCDSHEKAIEIAGTHPGLCFPESVLEIREIWDELDPEFMGDELDRVDPDYHLKSPAV